MLIQLNSKPLADFDDPLGVLHDCHRRIENFLEQLIMVTSEALASDGVLSDQASLTLAGALRYFRIAAPKHVLDEEETLFPRLRASNDARVSETFEQIERLEKEHDKTNSLHAKVDELGRAWIDTRQIDASDLAHLKEMLEELHSIYTEHIKVEENHIFPLAQDVINKDEQVKMGREMKTRRQPGGIDMHSTLSALVNQVPARARIFDELKLSYCCSGTTPLEDACIEQGLDIADVVRKLAAVSAPVKLDNDWDKSETSKIVDHISRTHLDKLHEDLPHAMFLASTVARVHGARKEGVVEAHLSFAKTAKKLETRADNLGLEILPKLTNLPEDSEGRAQLLREINETIEQIDAINAGFVELHEILHDYIVPEGACTKHRTMLATFERMEKYLQESAQIERDVLYPRIESQLA